MYQVVREDLGNLHIQLNITIDQKTYMPKVQKKLSALRGKVQMKGFRPGKSPANLVNNMYGNSVMDEIIIDDLNHTVSDYLRENNLKYFGEPLPVEGHIPEKYSYTKPSDVTFKLEFGIIPPLELKSLTKSDEFPLYKIDITNEMLDKEWETLLKRFADSNKVTEGDATISNEDHFEVHLQELEGDAVKENGIQNTATLFMEYLTDESKALFSNLKIGDSVNVNAFELEASTDRKTVINYILGLKDAVDENIGENYRAEVKSITKVSIPEENAELYNKIFPESGFTDKFQALDRLKEELENSFLHNSEDYVKEAARRLLIEKNDFELPESFLKRLFTTHVGDKEASMTAEDFESRKDGLFKDMKWSLINSKFANEEEIEIDDEDIKMEIAQDMSRYFGGNIPYEYINSFYDSIKKDEKKMDEYYMRVLSKEVLNVLFHKVSTQEVKVSLDEWKEKVQELNAGASK